VVKSPIPWSPNPHRFAPQRIKLRGDLKKTRVSTQRFRQKRHIGNNGEMCSALWRFLRPNAMPPERQGWQRNVANCCPPPVCGDGLAALSVVSGDLDPARRAVLKCDVRPMRRANREMAAKADRHCASLTECRCDREATKLAFSSERCEARAGFPAMTLAGQEP